MFFMSKFGFLYVLIGLFLGSSFVSSIPLSEVYQIELEAGGCHYQVLVNDKKVMEGKSYQNIEKKIKINDQLTDDEEQLIDVHMYRISREIPLKNTKAFVRLKLQKTVGDSVITIKELKLPTFPYDDDQAQPQSISGSVVFKTPIQKSLSDEPAETQDSLL
jgi:hypothetical protein